MPAQARHWERFAAGSVPGAHGSHATCAALATRLSWHREHSLPSALTVPVGQFLQFVAETALQLPVALPALAVELSGADPGGQAVLGCTQVALSILMLGGLQSLQMPQHRPHSGARRCNSLCQAVGVTLDAAKLISSESTP